MHFSAPVALLALAAGVQAGGHKQQEPPVHQKEASHSVHATGVQTGTHPIVTGGPVHGKNSTVVVTSTAPCHNGKCFGSSSTVPGTKPTSSGLIGGGGGGVGGGSGSGSGSGSPSGSGSGAGGSGAGNTPASPSSTGFTPSNPGSKVSVPMAGAALGSVAYGLALLA
ncbi:hypothetical protein PENSTE_c005G00261 [Penicillium steckii]|uniref:Uncharacterized protein n=1 Tax=Penicillium steckii TaxID=303698 RepID=A0A1V6TKQ0_9EURO|nr:hypothetical protein PENSTE_c005G00261 [Penicillium steckii]